MVSGTGRKKTCVKNELVLHTTSYVYADNETKMLCVLTRNLNQSDSKSQKNKDR